MRRSRATSTRPGYSPRRCATTPTSKARARALELSIVPFLDWPPGVADLDTHNLRLGDALLRDGRKDLAPAVIDGRAYRRPCVVNYRTSDEDVLALVEIAREVGARLAGA